MSKELQISNLFEVAGQCVAITGAGSGIGRMIAKGFAANGASLILIDVNSEGLSATENEVQQIHQHGSNSLPSLQTIIGDLSSEEGVRIVSGQIKAKTSELDAIFHCAGVRYMNEITYVPGKGLEDLEKATLSASYQDWERTFRINVLAPYYLTGHLITMLGKAASKGCGRGSVVLFSSPAGIHNHQFVPSYQTSKASVDHLVRVMAAEFAEFYIRVNAISPGIVPSGITTTDGTSNIHLVGESPAKRAGDEQDMVGCALWLSSRAGAFMDGKTIQIEGGRLLVLRGPH